MKVKVIVAVATAVCLGALSVVVFTKTSVRVDGAAPHVAATATPKDASEAQLHEFLSGATPDPKVAP